MRLKKVQIKKINSLPDSKPKLVVFNGEVRFIAPTWSRRLNKLGFTPQSDWAGMNSGTCVSESEITNCFRIELGDGHSVFFKRYTYPQKKQSRYWMRASKAQVEMFGYQQLRKLEIPTLKVIAFGESRSFGRLKAAYIITEGIDGSMDLQQFAREVWLKLAKPERSQIYLKLRTQLFEQLNRAHQAKFFHQDLHWRNILVSQNEGEYKTTWIDCPRAAYRNLPINAKHGQMVDLSCLGRRSLDYLSRSERYRALSVYLQMNNQGWTIRSLFKEIQAHHKRSPNPPRPLGIESSKKQFKP